MEINDYFNPIFPEQRSERLFKPAHCFGLALSFCFPVSLPSFDLSCNFSFLPVKMSDYIPKLNQLPDLPLLEVFDRVPVADLFSLGSVCHRWYDLAKSARARRRCLAIHVESTRDNYFRDFFKSSFSRLRPKAFCPSTANQVMNHFSAVTCLSVTARIFSGIFDHLALIALLTDTEWSSKLKSLKLDDTWSALHNLALINAINALPALKCLSLCHAVFTRSLTELPIIGRLEKFFYSFQFNENWFQILEYAESNKALREIKVWGKYYALLYKLVYVYLLK